VEEEADCGHVREKKRVCGPAERERKEREKGRMGLGRAGLRGRKEPGRAA
jgi:hypothetical protein